MEFNLTSELLDNIAGLPRRQRDQVMRLVGKREFDKCADDPLYWMDASRHVKTPAYPEGLPYLFTEDPHGIYRCNECGVEEVEDRRTIHLEIVHKITTPTLHIMRSTFTKLPDVRAFPNVEIMEYAAPIVEAWLVAQYFVIEKSRDMSATWLMIALHTWDAMFHTGRQFIFQSEDAFKTLELVQRAECIYKNTPAFLRDAIGPASFSKGTTKSGEGYFSVQRSEILGLPQGANQIRQFHPSGVFSDEAAFQVEAAATFGAIKPAIMQGGKYSAISSANRSWFELVCRDRTDDN